VGDSLSNRRYTELVAGKKVLVSPQWIERVSWSESKVFVNLSREVIRRSPEYRMESPPTRDYETGLYLHYDRRGYWIEEPATKEHSRDTAASTRGLDAQWQAGHNGTKVAL